MYTPRIPPAKAEELLPYLDDELVRIATVVNELSQGLYPIHYTAPTKVKPGLVLYADGTNWNPGSGEGLYRYNLAGSWVFIG